MQLFIKEMFGSGTKHVIISSEEMNDIRKQIKSLEVSGLLIKNVSKTIKKWSQITRRRVSRNIFRHSRC